MIAALTLAAATAAGAAGGAAVTTPGQRFAPAHVTVLVGEQVVWRNTDASRHVVRAEGGAFDSGSVPPGGEFAHRFDAPGTYRYLCTIHRFMRGSVEVATLALSAPAEPAAVGAPVELEGRAPAPGPVTLERDGVPVAATETGTDGRFRFEVVADAPARYRARSGELSSGIAVVRVAPAVRLAARRVGRRVSIRVHVTPAQAGGRLVVERHDRESFGYVRLRALTLDGESRGRIVLRHGGRLRLRARLAIPVDGYGRAVSTSAMVARAGMRAGHREHRAHHG